MATGKLIVFEGLRGAGKSTCLRAVAQALRSAFAVTVHETSQPTHMTAPGALARRILRGEVPLEDPRSFQLLCAADRLEHVVLSITPALARGQVVLCDRYVLSSAAYAPTDPLPFPWEWIRHINQHAPLADLTIVLYLDAEQAAARVLARDGSPDRLAATPHQAHVFYTPNSPLALRFAHSHRVSFVDASLPPDVVACRALDEVVQVLDLDPRAA